MAAYSSILAWKFSGQRSLAGYSPWGRKRFRRNLATKQQQQQNKHIFEFLPFFLTQYFHPPIHSSNKYLLSHC